MISGSLRLRVISPLKQIISLFLFLCLIFLHFYICSGQDNRRQNIVGRVIDNASGQPLHFANVFLANTMKGAATDEDGFFTIYNVPFGRFELVVTMMGYQYHYFPITITPSSPDLGVIRLLPQPVSAPALEVTATRPEEWKLRLKRFKKYFFGESRNGPQNELLNPEVLSFSFSERTKELIASASSPLEIENKALGYRLTTHLLEFNFRNYYDGSYLCKTKYDTLIPKNKRERKRWTKNRKKAYYGSQRHFLTSLYHDKIDKENFHLYLVPDFLPKDIFLHYYKIDADSVLGVKSPSNFRTMGFDSYLLVIYLDETPPFEYTWDSTGRYADQRSWIQIQYQDSVFFDNRGCLRDPQNITTYGFMAWERMAEAMPLDYNDPSGEGRKDPPLANISEGVDQDQIRHTTIKGKVISEDTGIPLDSTFVFISQSTIGTVTDTAGKYSLNVPPGNHIVVATKDGFDPLMKAIPTQGVTYISCDFSMEIGEAFPTSLENLALINEDREFNISTFNRVFLKKNSEIHNCTIQNLEALQFRRDNVKQSLIASATEPLIILNKGLGYKIFYILQSFSLYDSGEYHYQGLSHFTPLESSNPDTIATWHNNRHVAYHGSERHFLRSLLNLTLDEEGFWIRASDPYKQDRTRLTPTPIKAYELLEPTENPHEAKLSFDNYLEVIYTRESTLTEFPGSRYEPPDYYQKSWINIKIGDSIIVQKNGNVLNPYAYFKMGYWTKERMANALPFDYSPQ